jgi:hypothetical protein
MFRRFQIALGLALLQANLLKMTEAMAWSPATKFPMNRRQHWMATPFCQQMS